MHKKLLMEQDQKNTTKFVLSFFSYSKIKGTKKPKYATVQSFLLIIFVFDFLESDIASDRLCSSMSD